MENIFHRVSIRKYEDKPVGKEKILQILKAGMQAPSACNQQPWEFYVVTDKEKIQELSKATPYSGCAAGAPVVIVPVYRKEVYLQIQEANKDALTADADALAQLFR